MLSETETLIVALFAFWQILVPVFYSIVLDKPSRFTDRLLYVFASIALSLLAMTFLYTIFSRLGLVDFLARLDASYANYFIMLIVFVCPLLIATGYYALQHYNTKPND
ncbi:MAG TPA: hypothetical protein VIQ03_05595 [Gammaproteobacteria bacterium]